MSVKEKQLLLIIGLLFFVLPIFVSAAPSAGIKPTSVFYFLDIASERISLFFTFNTEKKIKKALAYANERLAEMEAVAEENDSEAIKKAVTNYESNIALATENSKEIKNEEQATSLLTSIVDSSSRNQEFLSAVLVKVPEEAKEAIAHAIEASKKGHEEALQKITELKGEVKQLKQEVAELKSKDERRQAGEVEQLRQELVELKARDEEQAKVIEELNKRKPQTTPTPVSIPAQPSTSKSTEITPVPKPDTTSQVPIKKDEPQSTPPAVQIQDNNTSAPTPPPSPTPTPSSITPPPITTPQTEALEITSVSVVPDVISARIEWQTNKPTSAKVFISGGGLSSKVYSSESGQSTRHVANIVGFISNTSYSYEIESIAGEQVVKKDGAFATKTGELTIEADKTSIQFINGHSIGDIRATAKYTENGKIVVPVDISFSAPDDSKTYRITELSVRPCSSYHPFHIQLIGSTGGSCTADANVTFSYAPKSLGTHTISVTAKGITKSVNIQVTEYEIVDPTIEVLPMHVDGIVMSIPIFDLGNHYGTVGRFKILPEESYSDVTDKQYESDAPHAEYLLWLDPRGNGEYGFKVSAQFIDGTNNTVYKLPTGTYTIVLKGLRVLEKNLGQYRNVSGLPVTFTFKVVGQYP